MAVTGARYQMIVRHAIAILKSIHVLQFGLVKIKTCKVVNHIKLQAVME